MPTVDGGKRPICLWNRLDNLPRRAVKIDHGDELDLSLDVRSLPIDSIRRSQSIIFETEQNREVEVEVEAG